ncbi:ankyrin repeat domain-containing protein 65-like isoform X2 [Sitodiplosis mosellana]|uniref:ankyrin repeat domain-containing protein 65-like isoform X2 n=1 Tax=Sitodiplosis mosellana TaxID=263140 RepID=UPI00244499A0|nr:ankyrin repeat domain-containing protein 65-like isoform X2 [Sitodiplosis mosellana]
MRRSFAIVPLVGACVLDIGVHGAFKSISLKASLEQQLWKYFANGNLTGVRALIEQGVNVNAADYAGLTALHFASSHADIVRLLIEKGANVNVENRFNETPLHRAAEYGHVETVRVLTEEGANVNAEDQLEETPLHKASGRMGKSFTYLH